MLSYYGMTDWYAIGKGMTDIFRSWRNVVYQCTIVNANMWVKIKYPKKAILQYVNTFSGSIHKVRTFENRDFWPLPMYAFRTFDLRTYTSSPRWTVCAKNNGWRRAVLKTTAAWKYPTSYLTGCAIALPCRSLRPLMIITITQIKSRGWSCYDSLRLHGVLISWLSLLCCVVREDRLRPASLIDTFLIHEYKRLPTRSQWTESIRSGAAIPSNRPIRVDPIGPRDAMCVVDR